MELNKPASLRCKDAGMSRAFSCDKLCVYTVIILPFPVFIRFYYEYYHYIFVIFI